MITTETISVINRYTENHEDKYQSTVIHGVFWFAQYHSALSTDGRKPSNSVIIRIPFHSPKSAFVPPKQWGTNHSGWTLQEGDYIVKGEIDSFTTTSALRESGKEVVTITGFTENRRSLTGLKHWKVVCK